MLTNPIELAHLIGKMQAHPNVTGEKTTQVEKICVCILSVSAMCIVYSQRLLCMFCFEWYVIAIAMRSALRNVIVRCNYVQMM